MMKCYVKTCSPRGVKAEKEGVNTEKQRRSFFFLVLKRWLRGSIRGCGYERVRGCQVSQESQRTINVDLKSASFFENVLFLCVCLCVDSSL